MPTNLRDKILIASENSVIIESKTKEKATAKTRLPRRYHHVPLVMMMPRPPRKRVASAKKVDYALKQECGKTSSNESYDADVDRSYDILYNYIIIISIINNNCDIMGIFNTLIIMYINSQL